MGQEDMWSSQMTSLKLLYYFIIHKLSTSAGFIAANFAALFLWPFRLLHKMQSSALTISDINNNEIRTKYNTIKSIKSKKYGINNALWVMWSSQMTRSLGKLAEIALLLHKASNFPCRSVSFQHITTYFEIRCCCVIFHKLQSSTWKILWHK